MSWLDAKIIESREILWPEIRDMGIKRTNMKKDKNNYAFIDSQNLNLSLKILDWKLDYARFRVYLKEKYGVEKAVEKIKGNVDADLVLQTITEINKYNKAVIVSNDGDFYSLVRYLYENKKLETVLSPAKNFCSNLLKHTAREKIQFIDDLKNKLEYKKKHTA